MMGNNLKTENYKAVQEVLMPYIGLALVLCNVIFFLYTYMS